MDVTRSIYLLDTNTATYIADGRSEAVRRQLKEAREHSTIAISTVTAAELLFGVEKKPDAGRLRVAVERLFDTLEILPWDFAVARAYGKLRAQLSKSGKTLAALDMQIAAHAVAVGAVLVTHDKAFEHASAFLDVVDWAIDL